MSDPDGGESESLLGGSISAPRRVGATVVRRPGRVSRDAIAALEFLGRRGWSGAPRLLRADDDGTQVVTYLEGRVPWEAPVPDWAVSDAALAELARLVRELHDLTAGTPPAGTGEGAVLCHHDLAPNNTVYRAVGAEWRPYAFIDWDLAGPGRRIEDVAHVCWQWLDLGPEVPDVAEAARRIRLIGDAYGGLAPGELVATAIWWQDRCRHGIEAGAAAGDPALLRLVAQGVPEALARAQAWTAENQTRLTAG